MRGHLVLDASPHFLRIRKRQRKPSALGPATKNQSTLMPEGKGGTLRIWDRGNIVVKIITMHRYEVAFDFRPVHHRAQPRCPRHPFTEDAVGKAAFAILIFRPFFFENL